MIKIFTTILIILACCTLSQAQNRSGGTEFSVGAGYNRGYLISNMPIPNTTNAKITPHTHGFNVSIAGDHYFSDRWSIKTKLIYDQKGTGNGRIRGTTVVYTGLEFRTTYLTLPVMANFHFGKTRNFYVNAGPYIGFLLSAKASLNSMDIKNSFNTIDGGLSTGVGIKLPIAKRTKFYIELDAQNGGVNIVKGSVATIRNLRGSFNVGLNF